MKMETSFVGLTPEEKRFLLDCLEDFRNGQPTAKEKIVKVYKFTSTGKYEIPKPGEWFRTEDDSYNNAGFTHCAEVPYMHKYEIFILEESEELI